MYSKVTVVLASLIALTTCASLYADGPVVQTKNGNVVGRKSFTVGQGKSYYSFRGIPFAEPPINNLRFEPPVPKSNWADTLDATEDGEQCIQGSNPVEGSEDCLFINVYTPTEPSTSCNLLPTLVWIYGGGFEGGNSKYELYGPDHLLDQGLVVVTFNYRLGLLGFASTGDLVVPGNNGLKDQLLALKWVQNNIKNFCGNPNEITLAGQSAGSASVAYHIQSPKSKGLFHRAILQSGVSLSLWAYSRRIPETLTAVAAALGVDTSSSRSIIDGLKRLDVTELQVNASSTIGNAYLSNNPREGFAMGPTSEVSHPDAFFTGRMHQELLNGNFNAVPIFIGFNSLEGTFNFELQYERNPEKMLPIDMNIEQKKQGSAGDKLKKFYFGWLPVYLANAELMKYISDDQFVRPIREFARQIQKKAPVYLYRFSYEGGLWGIYNRTNSGVTHSEELGYYWVSKHDAIRSQDFVVRDRTIKLWSNFIKTGQPAPTTDPLLQNINWQSLNAELNYVDIGKDLVAGKSPEDKYMKFWDDFYVQWGKPPYNTY